MEINLVLICNEICNKLMDFSIFKNINAVNLFVDWNLLKKMSLKDYLKCNCNGGWLVEFVTISESSVFIDRVFFVSVRNNFWIKLIRLELQTVPRYTITNGMTNKWFKRSFRLFKCYIEYCLLISISANRVACAGKFSIRLFGKICRK